MTDKPTEAVARAICRSRQWDEDEFWKTAAPDARAAILETLRQILADIPRDSMRALVVVEAQAMCKGKGERDTEFVKRITATYFNHLIAEIGDDR